MLFSLHIMQQCLFLFQKHFDFKQHENVSKLKKYQMERSVEKLLKEFEKQYGRGQIAVEEEIPSKHFVLNNPIYYLKQNPIYYFK